MSSKCNIAWNEKTCPNVLHWGLGPTLGKSWVLFDTSRRQVGNPGGKFLWCFQSFSTVWYRTIGNVWDQLVVLWCSMNIWRWTLFLKHASSRGSKCASVLECPSCYTLRPFFFAGLHPAIAWARRSARVVQRSSTVSSSRTWDTMGMWCRMILMPHMFQVQRSLTLNLVTGSGSRYEAVVILSTQKNPFGCQVKYPMTRWVAYIMYLDMIFHHIRIHN